MSATKPLLTTYFGVFCIALSSVSLLYLWAYPSRSPDDLLALWIIIISFFVSGLELLWLARRGDLALLSIAMISTIMAFEFDGMKRPAFLAVAILAGIGCFWRRRAS